jgi:hypothetical protein
MKHILLIVALLFTFNFAAQAQDPVSEAKAKIVQEHHDKQVAQAKSLLAEKAELEAKLAKVNQKLEKLAKGEDVEEEIASLSNIVYSGTTLTSTSCCCCWTTSGTGTITAGMLIGTCYITGCH